MCTASVPESDLLRRTIHFTGCVQGVGFRYTAESVVAPLGVTGYVRNLPDGRVELVAEGSIAQLDRMQAAVQRAMQANISEVSAAESPATGEFTAFRISF